MAGRHGYESHSSMDKPKRLHPHRMGQKTQAKRMNHSRMRGRKGIRK